MAALPEIPPQSIWRNPNADSIPADEQLNRLVNAWAQNDPITQQVSVQVAEATDLLPPLANLVAQYAETQLPKSVGAWHTLASELYPEGLRVTPLPANIVTTLRSPLSPAEQAEFGATNRDGSLRRVCDVFHLIQVQGSINQLDQRLQNYNARHLLPRDRGFFRILEEVIPVLRPQFGDISEEPGWALVSDITPLSRRCHTAPLRDRFDAMNCDFLSSLPLACSFAFTRALTSEIPLPQAARNWFLPTATRVAIDVPHAEPPQQLLIKQNIEGLGLYTCDAARNEIDFGASAVRRWHPTDALL